MNNKKIAPIIITILFIIYFAFIFFIFATEYKMTMDGSLLLMMITPLICIVFLVRAFLKRMDEIDGGEEDASRKY